MQQDAGSLREDLYRVVHYYAELSQLAQKGAMDPMSQIGQIVKNRFPYLLIVIRDLLPLLERDVMTYHEVLFNIIRAAQQFPDRKVLLQSRDEIEKIESEGRFFLYAVKWMDVDKRLRPSASDVQRIHKTLADLNRKYRERFAPGEDSTATLIPSYLAKEDFESEEVAVSRMADLVRRAILELFRLMIEHQPSRFGSFFGTRDITAMEEDVMNLAWFLFRCGFTVDRISSGYYKDLFSEFLNEKLLDYLIANQKSVERIQGLSNHLAVISLMDFGGFFELPSDYCPLDDPKEVTRHARFLRNKGRRGAGLLRKVSQLHDIYGSKPQGVMAKRFLSYRYYSALGDYHGEHRYRDARIEQAIRVYKPVVDREAMEKRTKEDIKESGRFFSSKTRDEMTAIIKLILDSLEHPEKVRRGKVRVLGDISSGAMGKVSIGIFRGRIVALKTVKSQISHSFGDPEALLEYEAAMHAIVQKPAQHPYVVQYHGLVEQTGEKLLINAYHPSDSLTQLVEKNWGVKYKPPFSVKSELNLETLEVVISQLLECLRLFRSKGVIHRDLKTDNVLYLVDENRMASRIKVIDFGVALAVGPGQVEDYFKGKVVGTFSYMAPEQVRGKSVFQSDLYSVGAILTVMLTGKLPMIFPKARTRTDLSTQILRVEKEARPRLTELNPMLAKNRILRQMAVTSERMLDLDPMRRPTLEEAQKMFDDIFGNLGDDKRSLCIFYHRG